MRQDHSNGDIHIYFQLVFVYLWALAETSSLVCVKATDLLLIQSVASIYSLPAFSTPDYTWPDHIHTYLYSRYVCAPSVWYYSILTSEA